MYELFGKSKEERRQWKMNIEDIEKLSEEEKIELLKNTIVNDNLYLRKLYILLNLHHLLHVLLHLMLYTMNFRI